METMKYKRYTPEEENALRNGATKLPGRTNKAVYQHRRELGLVKPAAWTPDERKLAELNQVPEGRTKAAMRCFRHKAGFTKSVKTNKNGQMEIVFTNPSKHSNKHISDIVGQFARTVNILAKSGMTVKEIAEQTNKSEEQVELVIKLSKSLRIK